MAGDTRGLVALRRVGPLRAAVQALVVCGVATALLVGIVTAVTAPAADRRARPGLAWLSGEAQGRAVLAAPGAQLGSVAVAIDDQPTEYDIAQVPGATLVFAASTGVLTRLDPALGSVKNHDVFGTSSDARLVEAGDVAYLYEPSAGRARRIDRNGVVGASADIGAATSFTGTHDGRLWLVDSATGTYATFDGATSRRAQLAAAGGHLTITAVGDDPVVLDNDAHRLRWLRRASTVDIGDAAPAVVQEPDLSVTASCVTVASGTTARCYGIAGVELTTALPTPVTDAAQVIAGAAGVVVATPGDPSLSAGPWGSAAAAFTRAAPSTRRLTGWLSPASVLVDDPGSRFAFSLQNATMIPLDKFSTRTVLLTADGPKIDVAEGGTTGRPLRGSTGDATAAGSSDPNPTNEPPTPQPDRARTRSGRTVTIDVLANDTDPDHDPLVVVDAGPVRGPGDVKVLESSRVLYAPPADFRGTVTFDYTVADPGGLRASAVVTVDVIGPDENTPPVATDDAATTSEDVATTVPVLGNDTDADGDPLTIVSVGKALHGTVAIAGPGFVRYEPSSRFSGSDRFTYTVSDGFGGTATATVAIEVAAAADSNRPPVAVDDRGTVTAGRRLRLSVLNNDSDPDGDPIHIVSAGSANGLDVTVSDGQYLDLSAASTASGVLTFPYTIEDSGGLRATAEVIVVVERPTANRPPQAVADSGVAASVAVTLDVVANDIDPDGDPLTVVAFTQPASGGTVQKASATSLQFQPTSGFLGTARFTYTVSDPRGLTSIGTVTVEVVAPSGSGPIARDDLVSIFPGESAVVAVLANDSHPDGLPFTLAGPPVVRSGTAVVNSDGSITFTPPDTSITTYTLTYTIRDIYGRTATAKIVVTVQPRPIINRPPLAVDDRASTAFGTPVTVPVLANDSDPDGQPVTLVSVAGATNGTATLQGSQVLFTPATGYFGLASFTYTIADPAGLTASAQAVIQVADRIKLPPIARDDLTTMLVGATTTIDPRVNDSDPDGTIAGLVVTSVGPSSGVTATIVGGLVELRAPAAAGTYTVPYTITDPDGLTASATITVTVDTPPNRPPIAKNDAASTPYGTAVSINVLANDTDPDGGPLTITAIGPPPTNGSAQIVNGAISYTPASSFSGVDRFGYTIADDKGATASAVVTVTVNACSAVAPALTSDSTYTRYATPVTIGLFSNDASPVGTLVVANPNVGSVAVNDAATGTVTYTPPNGFNGTAGFSYTVTNACGVSATASVSIQVNRAPTANPDAATTAYGVAVPIAVLANDTDPDNDPLTIVSVASPVGGTAAISGSDVVFTPAAGFSGVGGFSYTIRDIGGLTSSAAVTVTVSPRINHPPIAVADSASTAHATAVTVLPLANDSDPDGDALTLTSAGPASPVGSGAVTIGGASVTFTPAVGFTGTATIPYSISDGNGGTASSTISVSVAAPINHPPTANPDTASTLQDTAVTVTPLTNDSDPDNDVLTIVSAGPESPVGAGTVSATPTTVTFTPTTGFVGIVTIPYTISDGRGGTASSTITVTVVAANRPPIALPDLGATRSGVAVSVNVLLNDSDPDGDPLTITSVVLNVGAGTFSYSGALVTFTPDATFIGTAVLTYSISDGRGGTASATLTIEVLP